MRTTVVELAAFIRAAKDVMTEAEREALVTYLSEFPDAGVSLGGGLWKLRFARTSSGKRGGFRVIHYYLPGRGLPVFLMTVFAKTAKADLTPNEQAGLTEIGARIATGYGGRQ